MEDCRYEQGSDGDYESRPPRPVFPAAKLDASKYSPNAWMVVRTF